MVGALKHSQAGCAGLADSLEYSDSVWIIEERNLSEGPSAAMGAALPEDVHDLFFRFLVCGCERTARGIQLVPPRDRTRPESDSSRAEL